jgi:hypothetical protein
MLQREEAAAVSSTGTSDVVERRRRRVEGRRRRLSFSVPRPGGEAQEAEVRRKKKALWG